jgi:hypothetical protein
MQTFTGRSKTCSNAMGPGFSQKVTKRTKPEFGVNADTSFSSFASVNLFRACSRLAASRRFGGTHSRYSDSRLRGASVWQAAPWLQHRGTEMVKAFARARTPFQFLSVLGTSTATLCSFTVCSRPLAAQACSLQAGRSLFGFARPAL